MTTFLALLDLLCGLYVAWWTYRWITSPHMPPLRVLDWAGLLVCVVVWPIFLLCYAFGLAPGVLDHLPLIRRK